MAQLDSIAGHVKTTLEPKNENEEHNVKSEIDIVVKPEPVECIICASKTLDDIDIFEATSTASATTLHELLLKFTNVDLANQRTSSSNLCCRNCFDLIDVLERTEIEYKKLKQTFDDVISRNPLFEKISGSAPRPITLEDVKAEINHAKDSDDEPLAFSKKKHGTRTSKRKKNVVKTQSKKTKDADSWSCDLCDVNGYSGGVVELTAHKLVMHSQDITIKTENYADDDSQDTECNNGFDSPSSDMFKTEASDAEDDLFLPLQPKKQAKPQRVTKVINALPMPGRRGRKPGKTTYHCDKCDEKFNTISRLKQHDRTKHEDSRQPYICEICGAHYKHKRACDIHIQLHKGISNWKCEECNKLFPSKCALQRHNNIHTGKLNYQCDLCGKSFIHTSSFKMHKLTHSGLKPHKCDVCGLALMTKSHLKRHKRVHTGEKKHECTICLKRFSERYNLIAHLKSHEAENSGAPPMPSVPRKRFFRCSYCPERFERRYMLERHSTTVHGQAIERPPPTPRNTMSKLLKAQAQARRTDDSSVAGTEDTTAVENSPPPAAHSVASSITTEADIKELQSPPPSDPTPSPKMLVSHISSAAITAGGAWAGGGNYAGFTIRPNFNN